MKNGVFWPMDLAISSGKTQVIGLGWQADLGLCLPVSAHRCCGTFQFFPREQMIPGVNTTWGLESDKPLPFLHSHPILPVCRRQFKK